MRPGKPLMAGKSGKFTFVGLPGNPVSSMVCSHVFLKPMLNKMLGLKYERLKRFQAALTHELEKNGPREHYMRAMVEDGKATVQNNQDRVALPFYKDRTHSLLDCKITKRKHVNETATFELIK